MRHMLGNLSPNYFERTKRYMMLRASQQGTSLTVSGTPPLSLPNSLGKPLKAWSVDLLPYQEGTGDPSPSNVRAIHGTDKLTITTAGKNLFPPFGNKTISGLTVTANADGSLTIRGKATSSGAVIADAVTLVEPIPANTTVTFSTKNNVPTTLRILIEPNGSGDIPANGNYVSFTRPNVISGARLYLYTTVDNEYDFTIYPQLELGSAPSDYTPYLAPSQTVLTLPQTVYTGTIGSDGGESVDSAVDLGSLDWVYNSQNIAFYALVPDKAIGQPNKIMCEQYKPSSTTGFNLSDYEISVGAANSYVYIKDPRYSTVQDFKTAVSGVKLVYPLATPTTFAVPSSTIPTPTGTATTWATAEDGTVDSMEVTYVGKA